MLAYIRGRSIGLFREGPKKFKFHIKFHKNPTSGCHIPAPKACQQSHIQALQIPPIPPPFEAHKNVWELSITL